MKKNDLILAITVALYSFLFYQQTAGINFVIFNITLIVCLVIKDKSVLKINKWKIAAIGSLLSSFCIGYYDNTLSIIANIVSLSLLSGLTVNHKSSVIASSIFSFYSYFSAPVFMFLDRIEKKKNEASTPSGIFLKRSLLIGIPVLITLMFFFMYRESNPLFHEFSKNINFDFISFSWITFTIGGFILLYGFFYHKKIKSIADLDENAPNELHNELKSPLIIFGKELSISDEAFSGNILFILLNLLLLIVNLLDINFLFISGELPKGVTYSEFVHQGTGMLITSIIVAVIIILFYFRGAVNFYEKSKSIKLFAYLWITQNAFMLVSTALRNNMYITEFGLTYKRIGVYIYLILTLIGLATTFIKILKVKTNNYLFRTNSWLFYTVLIISCFFNWDMIITNFNIHSAKRLSKNYLFELSTSNLPELFTLQQDSLIKKKEVTSKEKEIFDEDNYITTSNFDERLSRQLYSYLKNRKSLNWKSWYYDNERVYNELISLNYSNKISNLKLPSMELSSLTLLKDFNNISELNLSSNELYHTQELSGFRSLKKLNLKNNKLLTINGLETLHELKYLDLSKNPIRDYAPLYNLKNLEELHIGMTTPDQFDLLQKQLPNTRIIRG